jgi:hypothetical protein
MQALVHILCCYWLPERPIGILVLVRELLREASTVLGRLENQQEFANRIGSVILLVALLQYRILIRKLLQLGQPQVWAVIG